MVRYWWTVLLPLFLTICGCDFLKETKPIAPPPSPLLKVSVVTPLVREIIDYEIYTGRTEAVDEVEIRAQVAGYLESIDFHAGAEVHKGDVLYTLDSRVYEAVVALRQSEVTACEARLKRLETELSRSKELLPQKAVSQADYDLALANRDESLAQLESGRANLKKAQIDLDYTRIISPINGVVSRTQISDGNLVSVGTTLLTTVVSMNPLFLFFDIDERTMISLAQMREQGLGGKDSKVLVRFGLGVDTTFPNTAQIDFVEPKVNKSTGTLEMRAVCQNDRLGNGSYKLLPGLRVRVQVPVSGSYQAVLIPEEAILTDQSIKYVFTVNEDNVAQFNRVKLGTLQEDNMRVIREGLTPESRIIVDGLLRVRPDIKVDPTTIETTSRVQVIREDGTIVKK